MHLGRKNRQSLCPIFVKYFLIFVYKQKQFVFLYISKLNYKSPKGLNSLVQSITLILSFLKLFAVIANRGNSFHFN